MLESRGHHVTSVLGNDEAFGLDAAVIAAVDSIVIGFSAPHSVRAAMIHWLKQHYPKTPVVVLRFHTSESFPEADGTVSDDPDIWMAAVASTLRKSA
jgi:DNA-binding NarL/FixJ family response regulator